MGFDSEPKAPISDYQTDMEKAGKSDQNDEELVRRTLTGNGEAFSELASRYAPLIATIARTKLGRQADLDEVVQECFVAAYCRLASLRDPGKFGPWLQGIVLNLCRKQIESRQAFQCFCTRHPGLASQLSPEEALARNQQTEELAKAIETLTPAQRQAIAFFYFHETSVEQIAIWLNRPVGTVKRTLSDARTKLRKELIDMARHDIANYHLSEGLMARLERIPSFPLTEPVIRTVQTERKADSVIARAPYGNFPSLSPGSEAFYADYDYPSRALTSVSHSAVFGPIRLNGADALRYDDASFDKDGKLGGIWRPHYTSNGSKVLYCAKEFGECESKLTLIQPTDPSWGEPQPEWEDLSLAPGSSRDPDGEHSGFVIDSSAWSVQIGRRTFECLRRVSGGGLVPCSWSSEIVGDVATEEFFLPDGRLLLWRRYNGLKWSKQGRPGKAGSFESLIKANSPMLNVFGQEYRLWYDQVPDYALK